MDETLLFPSPNWFLVSNFAVSENGWIVYGGPRKSLCVLEPTKHYANILENTQSYKAHVAFKGHQEKIVSVSISPDFVEKRNVLSGAADGSVRQWTLEKFNNGIHKIKSTHSHDVHLKDKEEIIGVDYSTESIAITVGGKGNIVKWDLSSNVCKTYDKLLASFKPTCMSCSPHKALNVAVGTKQGVVFVLDLTGSGKLVHKVRSQDDEVANLSWCPQYQLQVTNLYGPEKISTSSKLTPTNQPIEDKTKTLDKNESHLTKQLPQDSFEGSSCREDDMFDIYKDHEANEFGHKKYVPEDIVVKTKAKKPEETNYLQECLSLRELLLKRKAESEETSIESLVEAMDKAHVVNSSAAKNSSSSEANASESEISESKETNSRQILQSYRHLLAAVGKHGTIKIWDTWGRLVASCVVPQGSRASRAKSAIWPTILWATPGSLLVVDGKSQLVECNTLKIDRNNKIEYRVVHSEHKRGLYALATDAPRVQTVSKDTDVKLVSNPRDKNSVEDWTVYSVSQDRNIVRYSMKDNKTISIHNTCGGYVYNVQFCPYDAGRMAVGVGDGAIRVWDYTMLPCQRIVPSKVRSHWQKVQGKVLSVAWHPTKENLLAFGTAESRVGLLDVGGSGEKPARVLHTALTGGVYSLCWGSDMNLFAVGGDQLVMYDALTPDARPVSVTVEADGQTLAVGAVSWAPRGLLVGSHKGAVAVLHPELLTTLGVAYFYNKMVYMMEWHPLQVSKAFKESPHQDIVAVCSSDKSGNITIVNAKSRKSGRIRELSTYKVLSGHKSSVLQLVWSPHREELLLSTSSDTTVRVWNFVLGICLAEFPGHGTHTLGAAWLPHPMRSCYIVSGGADGSLRMWNYRQYSPHRKQEVMLEGSDLSNAFKNPLNFVGSSGDTTSLPTSTEYNFTGLSCDTTPLPSSTEYDFTGLSCDTTSLSPTTRHYFPDLSNASSSLSTKHDFTDLSCASTSLSTKHNFTGLSCDTTSLSTSTKHKKIDWEASNKKLQMNRNIEEQIATVWEIESKASKKYILPLINKQINLCEIAAVSKAFQKFVEKKPVELHGGPDFINIFGSLNEINELLDKELSYLLYNDLLEGWITLSLFRGQINETIAFARQRDMLCPYLVNMASCVSLKYMKEVTQAYIAQIDRFVAKKKEDKLTVSRNYGGAIYRKVTLLLSIHDVRSAVEVLTHAKLYKEAYILCRLRFMNTVADFVLKQWASFSNASGNNFWASICHMVLGNYHEASTILEKSQFPEILNVAANLARLSGSKIFASHIEEKAQNITSKTEKSISVSQKIEEKPLKELPSRIDLLLKVSEMATKPKNSTEDELDESPSKIASMKVVKDKPVEPLGELPSKTEELMKDVPSATITSEPATDRTDEPLQELPSKIKVLMKDVQGINSETDNSDEDIGHDFVTLQYEEILENND